jgi:hypothetical protein
MTPEEWDHCADPEKMLEFLRRTISKRRLRLFACASCRRLWRLFEGEERTRAAVYISERYADGLATWDELKAARRGARHCEYATAMWSAFDAAKNTAASATYEAGLRAVESDGGDPILAGIPLNTPAALRLREEESRGQCALLRDIAGNPFRPPPTVPADVLAYNGGAARQLAEAIYHGRRFEDLPVLADLLEEAGLTDAGLLGHLRGPAPHALGCAALDAVLGKS